MSTTNTIPLPGQHFISLPAGITMTSLYRANRENILATAYKGLEILPLSETFNRDAFDQLLALQGCAGLRIYYGMDEALKLHAIIVAVNELNEDILPEAALPESDTITEDGNYIAEEGQRCPPLCPKGSPLNG